MAAVVNTVALHEQLSVIMGALTRAAVLEICELVGDGYALLHAELARSHKENEELKKKMHLIESIIVRGGGKAVELEAAEGRTRPPDGDDAGVTAGGGGGGATETERELPDVVLIKDEDSDSNEEGTNAPDGATGSAASSDGAGSAPIRSKKRCWPGNEDDVCPVEKQKSPERRALKSPAAPKPSAGKQKRSVPQYILDSPPREPAFSGFSGQPGGDDDHDAGESVGSSYSSQIDPDVHLVHQECSLVPLASGANRPVAYFGGHGGTDGLAEDPSSSNKGELDLSLTWTKQSKTQTTFTQFHQNMDGDAFGLKLISVSGSVSTDGHISEGSNSAFELEESDMMNFSLYRDASGLPGARGKRFVCSLCNKSYATSQNLDVHMRIHTGERPFSCAQCGKKFTQSAHLKSHLSVHSGERPYSCAICNKSFIVKYSLKLHMNKCHPHDNA